MTRVLIVDDHRVIADGLQRLLELEPGVRVVGQAVSLREGLALCEQTHPDVVVLDLRLPDARGVSAVGTFRGQFPKLRIVALTGYGGSIMEDALKAGADAFLTKDLASESVLRAVTGGVASVKRSWDELSEREKQVARLAAIGHSNTEIGEQLSLSPNTVKTHLASLMHKLGVRNRTELSMRIRSL